MKDRKGFGLRIRSLRESRGLTIEEAAEQCEASVSIWRQYERGERLPSLTRLSQMCLVLNQKSDYFFGTELDELLEGMGDIEKIKSKIDKLLPEDLEVVDALITKFLEMRK